MGFGWAASRLPWRGAPGSNKAGIRSECVWSPCDALAALSPWGWGLTCWPQRTLSLQPPRPSGAPPFWLPYPSPQAGRHCAHGPLSSHLAQVPRAALSHTSLQATSGPPHPARATAGGWTQTPGLSGQPGLRYGDRRPWFHLSPSVSPFCFGPRLVSGSLMGLSVVSGGFLLRCPPWGAPRTLQAWEDSPRPLGARLPLAGHQALLLLPEAWVPPGLGTCGNRVSTGDEWHSCRGLEGMRRGRFGHCPLSRQPGIGRNH